MKPILLLIGTRPEAIKMLPIYFELKKQNIPVVLCATMQHEGILEDIFSLFNVVPDIQFSIMRPDQDLAYLTSIVLEKMKNIMSTINPRLVLIQGDTTSAMASALAAFYARTTIAHVEAGLRTGNIHKPFPEEMNRKLISLISTIHYAPTSAAMANLLSEGVARENIVHVGNTVVDMLYLIQKLLQEKKMLVNLEIEAIIQEALKAKKNIILLTVHRRESFGQGIIDILSAFKEFACHNQNSIIIYPHHPNPHVLKALEQTKLFQAKNIFIVRPMLYKDFVYTLLHASLIATDSGGVFEEAISLGKRVLVLREETERIEGIWNGLGHLVGTDKKMIERVLKKMNEFHISSDFNYKNIYGDGYAAQKIVKDICRRESLDDYIFGNNVDIQKNAIF